ncbi:HAUS augmin-like complex subunit 6 [Engraulis encrasicolus]|uniref:HAUS augmin-like complex subunit 6 n=1 Tax=Engraulis encrasicolus TaxID=184585 RepID=UPI002FD497B1
MSAVKKKQADILHMELENLAEQFALAVTTSPSGGAAEEGMSLEHLLSSMIQPLSARRQLPRTPEQILSEVRTSWRKVMEDSVTQKSSATTTTTTAARPSGKFPDSFTGLFTPFSEARGDPSLNPKPDTSLYPNNTFTLSSSSNTEAATRAVSVPLDVTYDNSAPLDVTTASSESFCLRPPVTPATMQYNTSGDQQGAAFPPLTTSFDSSISLSHRHHTETLGSSTTQRAHETEHSSNENSHEASALANHNSYEASALTNHSLYEVSALANPSSRDGFDFDFSLANESLPDLSSCDSLLANESLVSNTTASPSISRRDSDDMPEDEEDDDDEEEEEDGGDDEKQEVKELVSPQFPSQPADGDNKAAAAVLYARQRLQAIRERATALDQDLNLLSFSPTPSTLAKGRGHGEEAGGWENHTSQQQQEPFFSLDLEELDSPALSARHHGDMRHLPNLLSFSPVKQL